MSSGNFSNGRIVRQNSTNPLVTIGSYRHTYTSTTNKDSFFGFSIQNLLTCKQGIVWEIIIFIYFFRSYIQNYISCIFQKMYDWSSKDITSMVKSKNYSGHRKEVYLLFLFRKRLFYSNRCSLANLL